MRCFQALPKKGDHQSDNADLKGEKKRLATKGGDSVQQSLFGADNTVLLGSNLE